MIWTEEGLDESRANSLIGVANGEYDESVIPDLDDEDRHFIESCRKQLADAKERGVYVTLSIPQM